MTYAIVFCEFYHHSKIHKSSNKSWVFDNTRLLWVVVSMFLSMAFVGNLKSSLIRHTYTEKTQTLNEMIDKDMHVIMSRVFMDYVKNSASGNAFNQRLINHVEKKGSTVPDASVYILTII